MKSLIFELCQLEISMQVLTEGAITGLQILVLAGNSDNLKGTKHRFIEAFLS